MKKVFAIILAALMMCTLFVGCGGSGTYEIALVTDVGNIDDQSFNQSAWEGVVKYAEDNDISYAYYRPTEDSTDARVESISAAVEKGAKVVVCPGYLFEEAVYIAQDQHPDVQFLILDGEPHDAAYNYKTNSNVHCILYQEEQAGYFAGYAAVMDGYTKLGFLGGMDVPAVVRFGYGYVQGIDDAAAELGITDQIEVKYWYSGTFSPSDDIQTKMAGWYSEGTEIVFACGGGIYLSCDTAATAANAKMIGVDADQYAALGLETIVTSAMKGLTNSVVLALTDLYANNGVWPADKAGSTVSLGVADDCVGLPTAESSWRFATYTVEEYNALYEQVKNGEIAISNAVDAAPDVAVSVDYQN